MDDDNNNESSFSTNNNNTINNAINSNNKYHHPDIFSLGPLVTLCDPKRSWPLLLDEEEHTIVFDNSMRDSEQELVLTTTPPDVNSDSQDSNLTNRGCGQTEGIIMKLLRIVLTVASVGVVVTGSLWSLYPMAMEDVARYALSKQVPSVQEQLHSFLSTLDHNNDETSRAIGLAHLKTRAYHQFSISNCVHASSLTHLEQHLKAVLDPRRISAAVRQNILRQVLVPRVSQTNVLQEFSSDSTFSGNNDIENQIDKNKGRVEAIVAFWSTQYYGPAAEKDEHEKDNKNRNTTIAAEANTVEDFKLYETCLLLSGVSLELAPVVTHHQVQQVPVQIGTEPCDCGFFYCGGTCPVFQLQTTSTPIWNPPSLTLERQQQVHEWLMQRAVGAAQTLAPSFLSTPSSSSRSSFRLPNKTQKHLHRNATSDVSIQGDVFAPVAGPLQH